MQTLISILIDIINFVGSIYISLVVFRFLFQLVRADYYNPISKALVKLTNPLLVPLRKIIPGFFGIDFAALVLAIVLQALLIFTVLFLLGFSITNLFMLLPWSILAIVRFLFAFYFYGMFIIIIASWIAPYSYNPALNLLRQLIDPVIAPFRKIIPPMGGLDFSPMLFIFALMLLRRYLLPLLDQLFATPNILIFGF